MYQLNKISYFHIPNRTQVQLAERADRHQQLGAGLLCLLYTVLRHFLGKLGEGCLHTTAGSAA